MTDHWLFKNNGASATNDQVTGGVRLDVKYGLKAPISPGQLNTKFSGGVAALIDIDGEVTV